MALFSNESDKNVRAEQSANPQAAAMQRATVAPVEVSNPPPAMGRQAGPEPGAYLDKASKVSGKLNFEGAVRIDGEVEGEIVAKDSITIGETAVLKAQIKAASIVVSGTVSGEMSASQRIEIRASAKVSGNITAPKLIVHEGAIFEGNCAMKPAAENADRKVPTLRKEEHNGLAADRHVQA